MRVTVGKGRHPLALLAVAWLTACSAPATAERARVWGVTLDDVSRPGEAAAALAALPARPFVRVVFDEGQPAARYLAPLEALRPAADILGEVLDSRFMARASLAQYAARVREYLDLLGGRVDVWEVGNEVNGDWAGPAAEVAAKVRVALDLVKARGGRAALTLHYNSGCTASPEHELFAWVSSQLTPAEAARFDWVLVSYYEDDCPGPAPDWPDVFARLATLFPRARLGIGECGVAAPERKAEVLRSCYAIQVPGPRFLGGYFWWYFATDMVPASRPLHRTLSDVIREGRAR